MLSTGFTEVKFEHCNREANEVAHDLARHSFFDRMDCIWDDDPPSFLFAKLINNVTVFGNQ